MLGRGHQKEGGRRGHVQYYYQAVGRFSGQVQAGMLACHSLSGRISRKGLTLHPHPSGLGGNNRSEWWAYSKKLSKLGSQPQWLQRHSVFPNLPTSYRSLLFSWPESGCQVCPGEGRLLLTGEGRGSGVRPTNSMELGGQSKPPSPAFYQDKASILASISLSPEDFQGPS